MNWLAQFVVPHYAFAASYLQQSIADLHVKNLEHANGLVKEMKLYPPTLISGRTKEITEARVCTFPDAAFPKANNTVYGQGGILCRIVLWNVPSAAFHPLAWSSRKQTRVCRSATAAEILAVNEGEELGTLLCEALQRVCCKRIPHELNIDSRSLYEAMSTQHELKDFRMCEAAQSLRSSFETGEVAVLRWIAGRNNPADALTKRSPSTGELLSTMSCSGRLMLDVNTGTLERSSEDPTNGPEE